MSQGLLYIGDSNVERLALRMWQERELVLPKRVRRMYPDALDVSMGAWASMVEKAQASIEHSLLR